MKTNKQHNALNEKQPNQSRLYLGDVYHKRFQPFEHDFKYSVFSLLIDLDERKTLKKQYKWLSYNSFNLTSFYDKDHGARDGSDVKKWVIDHAQKFNIDIKDGKIFALCFPRILGYTFNPLTIYYCYSAENKLVAILYEVKNTFGDQHGYLCPINSDHDLASHKKDKIFHVSPFIQMEAKYLFSVREPDQKLNFKIDERVNGKPFLLATWSGKDIGLTSKNLLSCFFKIPFLTFKIMIAIHWQAFHLWRKGATFYKWKKPPKDDVS